MPINSAARGQREAAFPTSTATEAPCGARTRICQVDDDTTIRLGPCFVAGLQHEHGDRILAERGRRAFTDLADFQVRTKLKPA